MEDQFSDHDPGAEDRKKDHIALAFQARVGSSEIDKRFYYEPLLSGHPDNYISIEKEFLGRKMGMPLWVSSMTGGTKMAGTINKNLARACGEFKLAMGLGSCRQLLSDHTHLEDFAVRKYMGEQPLFANLGIAQIIQLLEAKKVSAIRDLIKMLEADGLIVHINPMQEFLQPEGDRYFRSPLEVIEALFQHIDPKHIIIKEVGQGMGPESIGRVLSLPVAALELAASGGTNFALLEMLRSKNQEEHPFSGLANIGHDAEEMVDIINDMYDRSPERIACKQIIISGGIKGFLDGYYLMEKLKLPSVYGQASGLLKYAVKSYEDLQMFLHNQKEGLALANAFLRVKKGK